MKNPVYLDCNATTPVESEVWQAVRHYAEEEFGNAGSRTHEFGTRAKQAVQKARDQVAAVVGVQRDEVVFTSGATESNNIAILGLARHAEQMGRRHLISTQIEHKAVLEPLEELQGRGFDVTLVPSSSDGRASVPAIRQALRLDTSLVSVMQVNNETGVRQPLAEICDLLKDHPAYLHVDAAQGFGKDLQPLHNSRIDLISVSAHKIYGPKGIGALILRRRGYDRPPVTPLIFGGGQERGLRPGTLPVPLIAGFGVASAMAQRDADARRKKCAEFRAGMLAALEPLEPVYHGDPGATMEHVLNLRFPGVDSEALMVALKDLIAISNGSACTSASYQPSHVLKAMGLTDEETAGAVRISWCHLTPDVDWDEVTARIRLMR